MSSIAVRTAAAANFPHDTPSHRSRTEIQKIIDNFTDIGVVLDGITDGTAKASAALIADANLDLTGLRHLTITGDFAAANLTLTGTLRKAYAAVAAAGSSQGDGTAMTAGLNYVTAADGNKGVVLPTAVAGMEIKVHNSHSTALLKVYPATGGQINALGANNAETVLPGEQRSYYAASATLWYALGNRVARIQHTSVAASDTVVTGLSLVTAAACAFDTDPADANITCSVSIGDQAGSPAAGSVLVKTWKSADGADVTPVAASAFSKKVGVIAIGS